MADLQKLRELAAKATPGPWRPDIVKGWDPYSDVPLAMVVDDDDTQIADCLDNTPGPRSRAECAANAAFIAAAREALPELLVEYEKCRPLAAGERCPRCLYVAPNIRGCARCNPEQLAERYAAALETIKDLRDEIEGLLKWKREVQRG